VPLTNVIIEIHLVLLFMLHNAKNIAYHITEVLIFYEDKLMVAKICVYLKISRFYSNRENLMLAKYTCFTVCSILFAEVKPNQCLYLKQTHFFVITRH